MSKDILKEFNDAIANLKQKVANMNLPNGKTITRKNTGESPKSAHFTSPESSLLTDFSTPIYNMRVTID